MRAPLLALATLVAGFSAGFSAGLSTAGAQVLAQGRDSGTSRLNQQFETQNQIRNMQQRQSLENSAVRNQIQRAPLNQPPPSGPGYLPRR